MKNLLKFSAFAMLFSLCALMSSCGDDDSYCFECTTGSDTETICEGDDNGNGGEASKAEIDAAVAIIEAFGGECDKQ